MNITTETYGINDENYDYHLKRLVDYTKTINTDDNRLMDNYTKWLNPDQFLAVSFYLNDGEIIGFSSMLHRPLFGNGVRVLNRYFKSSDIRHYRFPTQVIQQMIDDQCDIAKEMGYEFAFVSRETANGFSTFKRFVNYSNWKIDTDAKFKMFDSDTEGQYIVWRDLVGRNDHDLIKIT